MARILIMEDEVQMRALLRQILESSGHEVTEAANGVEGIRLYHEKPADLVIVDIIMPEKEGFETIRELKRDFPEVKLIAISGGGFVGAEPYLKMAESLGVTHNFAKPIEREELLDAVQELLS
jgi:YesN/AraC family two-component response regulator